MKILPGRPHSRSLPRPRSVVHRKLRPLDTARDRPLDTAPDRSPATARARVVPSPHLRVEPPVPITGPAPAPVATAAADTNALLLRGDFWEITYEGRTAIVEDCRGLRYIALLIQDAAGASGPVHAKELVARASGATPVATELERKELLLDDMARRQLMGRLEDIAAQRDRACAMDDFEEAAALDAECERVAEELSRAAADGKRRGTFTDGGEKARKAVAKAISEAVTRVASHPDLSPLAQHLSSAIRKGQWLSYTGMPGWRVDLAALPRK